MIPRGPLKADDKIEEVEELRRRVQSLLFELAEAQQALRHAPCKCGSQKSEHGPDGIWHTYEQAAECQQEPPKELNCENPYPPKDEWRAKAVATRAEQIADSTVRREGIEK